MPMSAPAPFPSCPHETQSIFSVYVYICVYVGTGEVSQPLTPSSELEVTSLPSQMVSPVALDSTGPAHPSNSWSLGV